MNCFGLTLVWPVFRKDQTQDLTHFVTSFLLAFDAQEALILFVTLPRSRWKKMKWKNKHGSNQDEKTVPCANRQNIVKKSLDKKLKTRKINFSGFEFFVSWCVKSVENLWLKSAAELEHTHAPSMLLLCCESSSVTGADVNAIGLERRASVSERGSCQW